MSTLNHYCQNDVKEYKTDDELLEEDERLAIAHVYNKIINNPDSHYATEFFKNKTEFYKKVLWAHPDLMRLKPKKKKGVECAWCKKGGKHKTVYTSHYMLNKQGQVTCPKLLKEQCRNCGKMGHIMGKHCPEEQKPRTLLLPPGKPHRWFNPREDEDYMSGDSEDYDKFPLSDDEEEEHVTIIDSSDAKHEPWNKPQNKTWEEHWVSYREHLRETSLDGRQLDDTTVSNKCDVKIECNPVVPFVEEKSKPSKKTWASIVSSKKA
jgi:hypothetical protein